MMASSSGKFIFVPLAFLKKIYSLAVTKPGTSILFFLHLLVSFRNNDLPPPQTALRCESTWQLSIPTPTRGSLEKSLEGYLLGLHIGSSSAFWWPDSTSFQHTKTSPAIPTADLIDLLTLIFSNSRQQRAIKCPKTRYRLT